MWSPLVAVHTFRLCHTFTEVKQNARVRRTCTQIIAHLRHYKSGVHVLWAWDT